MPEQKAWAIPRNCPVQSPIINIPGELTYKMLEKYRKEFLNLVDIDDFLRDLNNSG